MAYLPPSTPNPTPVNSLAALLGPSPSPLSSAALAGLADLFSKLPRRGLYYVDKDIELDGLIFEECSFENCRLVTRTGNFSIRKCRIYGPKTVFYYSDGAKKIVQLHELMNASAVGRSVFPQLLPTIHEDGRFTIDG